MARKYLKRDVLESEKVVLSSILYNFNEVIKIVDFEQISTDTFWTEDSKRIFQSIKKVIDEHGVCDLVLVIDALKHLCIDSEEFKNRMVYLNSLSDSVHYFLIRKHLHILQIEKAMINLSKLSEEILRTSVSSDNFDDLSETWKEKMIQTLESDLLRVSYFSAKQVVDEFQRLIDNAKAQAKMDFFKTGYRSVDSRIKYLAGGQLVVIASRPGIGKTTLALNIVGNNLSHSPNTCEDSSIGVFSLETPNAVLISKLIAIDSKVPLYQVQRMLDGETIDFQDHLLIDRSKNEVSGWNLLMCDDANITIGKIASTIRFWCSKYKLKLVIIDYLQLINFEDNASSISINQYQKIGIISRKLKVLAMDLNICIVALAQLNRKVEERKGADKSPLLSDLRESGSIEQDADVVMLLYEEKENDSNDNSNEEDAWDNASPDIPKTMMKIAKNRNGPVGTVEFYFDKSLGVYKVLV